MFKVLTEKTDIKKMSNTLNEEGVFIVENFVTGDDLQNLHDEVLNLCEKKGGNYEFGKNYRGPSLKQFKDNSYVKKVFNSEWLKQLDKEYRKTNKGYSSAIYATWDYKNDKGLARNGWLHFDRENCLKYFIYLTDIDKTNGALNLSPKSRKKGEELRNDAWNKNKNYGSVLNRIELDYSELLEEYPHYPIEYPAGTLIVFDTDTFHKGGLCETDKSRLIVRAHCK